MAVARCTDVDPFKGPRDDVVGCALYGTRSRFTKPDLEAYSSMSKWYRGVVRCQTYAAVHGMGRQRLRKHVRSTSYSRGYHDEGGLLQSAPAVVTTVASGGWGTFVNSIRPLGYLESTKYLHTVTHTANPVTIIRLTVNQ